MCDPSSSSPPILKCSPLGIYAPNPSFDTLAKRLYQLMVTVIRSKRVIQRSTRLSDNTNQFAFMSDASLPVAPVFRNVELSNDTIEDMEQAQHDALVTYFGLCLYAGSYETAAIHEDILPTALKRSSMSSSNHPVNDDEVMHSWAVRVQCVKDALGGHHVILNDQDPSIWLPKVVHMAQGEILTQYYSFALVKGPLSYERIEDAQKQALCTLVELNRVDHHSNPFAVLMGHDDTDDEQLSTDFPNSESDDALSDVMQKEDQESAKEKGSSVFSTTTDATEETTPTPDDKQSLPDTTPPSSPKSTISTSPLPPQQSSAPTKTASSWANVASLQRDKPVKPIKKRDPPPSSTKAAETTATTGTKGKLKSAKCMYYHFQNGKCRYNETQCHFAHEDLSKVDTCEAWRRSPDACENGKQCVYLHKHQPQQQKPPKNDLTKTRLCYDYMNSKCEFTEAECKYAHENTSRVPVCPDWTGIPGSCKKYEGWCNLLHPATTKKAKVPGDGEELFPALSSGVTESAGPDTPKPSATTSYADTVKREAPPSLNSPSMRAAAPPSPASSHATQVSMTIYDESKRKTQLCKYFKKGTCKFSTEEQCHFAHEDVSFVPVCLPYKEGKCKKEDECTFLHGLPKDDCRRKTKLCEAYLQDECPFDEERCDYAHEDTSKVPLCHYALSGLCISDPCCFRHQFGPNDDDITTNDMIQFQLDPGALHDQSIFPCLPGGTSQSIVMSSSIPSFADETLYSDAAKKPPKVPERGIVIQKRDPVVEEAIRHESLRYTKKCKRYWGRGDSECFYGENCWFAHQDVSKVRTCYFWVQGHCNDGQECPLLHPEREDDGYVPLHQNTRTSAHDMDKKTRKCWFFWYYEGCRNDPCYFAHEDLTDVGVCYYWQHNKKCPWDPACPYLHSDEVLGLESDDEDNYSAPSTPEPSMNVNEHDPRDVFAKLPSHYAMMNNTISQQRQRLSNKFRSKPSEDVVPRVSSGFENNEARYREHRREAFENAEKMIRATQKAEQARNCNEVTEAEEHERDARYYAKQMKAEHAKASQKIFEECNRGNPRKKYIDLHGQHVDEALQYIHRWFAEFQDQRDIVYIITGAGRHSRGIKGGKLRPAVEEYLKSRYMTRECSVHDDCTNSGGIYAVWYCVHKFVSSPARTCVFCSFKEVQ